MSNAMDTYKGIDVSFNGSKEIESFALSILYLTNLKSSIEESVVEFRTFMGTDLLFVTFYKEWFELNKDILERKIGSIDSTSERIIYEMTFDNLPDGLTKKFYAQMEKYFDDETDKEPEPYLNFVQNY